MPRKLVLFDIDGTLLNVGPVNRRVIQDALLEVYGTEGSAATHSFAGRMDNVIIREVLEETELAAEEIEEKFDRAKAAYIRLFRERATPADVTLTEGVVPLLERLASRTDILVGLLTGNFEASGRHKLKLPGINHFFPFGAFADDAPHRNDLPAVAVEKARQLTGERFSGHDVVVIGDTEHDINCARAHGALALAVATGTYSLDRLRTHEPDVLLENLNRPDIVIGEILRPSTI
ncbi:HAD family hydrolase [Chlorobium sp. N1]|uniref:HAD family hydrolase n=1 Tax=Chlorobium sp. N1 TaxID=2491138 RepID=UPI00103C4A75|nr:HAD family hydrolase [Chlorobium sp. N1]TCD48802.1 HAD family hydrolase [Chlorobium sp. N1]